LETVTDIIMAAILIFSVISGLRRGFIRSLVDFAGGIVALVCAVKYSADFAGWMLKFLGNSSPKWLREPIASKMLAVVILFILFEVLIQLVASLLNFIFRLPVLKQINALLGGIFGFCKGAVIVLLLCAVLRVSLPTNIFPAIRQPMQKVAFSRIYQTVYGHNPVYDLFQSKLLNEVGRNEKTKLE